MTVKRLIYYPQDEDLLRKVSKPVSAFASKRIKRVIQDLKDTLATQPGAAIAAVQIGVFRRITVVKFGQNDDDEEKPMLTLINPEIIEAGPPEPGFDGCLSIPDVYSWDTPRPSWIRYRAMAEDGSRIGGTVEGMDARVLHHEIDHFNGILFLDRVTDPDELYTTVPGQDGKATMVKISELAKMIE